MLTLLGSMVGLSSQHVEKTLLQGHTASELLPKLLEARALGERLRRELQVWQRTGHDVESGRELLQQAHRVAHVLHSLGPMIGRRPWHKRAPRRGLHLPTPVPT
ncbi:hypothetical protein [Archangium lansingense]|uniref:Uncharacterized protein n=1 Tax=Archangium lansingense TaxID=2995310 RepID=A0ABT4ALX5_9BACT|nr:hypothetical protein [Archangium lansinium]MCY1082685.1 hypothetical protein [Archangium lansinium]